MRVVSEIFQFQQLFIPVYNIEIQVFNAKALGYFRYGVMNFIIM